MTCNNCHNNLYECPECDGGTKASFLGTKLTCKTCNNTGSLCPNHDGFWK